MNLFKRTISWLMALLMIFSIVFSNTAMAIEITDNDETKIVATIGSEEYKTLQEAINTAKDGETIKLEADIEVSDIIVIDKAITLDGNGKTLTSTAARAINVSGADGVIIKNLTVNASGERAFNVIQNATNLSIENVTATAANYTVNVASSAPNAVINIKDSTLTGLCTVNVSAAGSVVTVTDSTINCNDYNTTAGESYAALSLNKEATNGKIAANGCTINVVADSDSVATRNAAEGGSVTVDGSSEGISTLSVVITYEGSPYYHGFTTLEKAIEFAKPGNTITLIRDIEASDIIVIDKAITIDFNGKTANAEFKLEGYTAALTAPEGLNIKSGIQGHSIEYKNGVYTINSEHDFKWDSNNTEHWQICDCGEISNKADHTWDSGNVTTYATCTTAGVTTYTCTNSDCRKTKTEQIAENGHSYNSSYTIDKKATMSANGSKSKHCKSCDAKTSVTIIAKIKSVSLSNTHLTYTGKVREPGVTVKDSNGTTLKKGTDYTVSYQSGRKNIGRYKVTVTLKGAYSGSKTLYFEIGPKKPATVKAELYGHDDVKLTWSKVEGATGYKVFYKKSTASEYTHLITTTGTSCTKSGLADGVKYDFMVMSYKKVDGNNCENPGKTTSIYTLKKITNVKAAKSDSKVKISWTNINGESGYQISQSTSKTGTNIVATYKTTSGKSVKINAKKGKTYYYKVRAYKTVDGKKIYGPWSDAIKYTRK